MKTRLVLLVWLFSFFTLAPVKTRAATIVVTNGTDAELRAAVAACGTVRFNFNGVIFLTNQIVLSCAVTIDGSGHAVTLSGGNSNRIFQVQPNSSLTLTNLTLANGHATNAGGAIYNDGTVLAYDCRFLSNVVIGAAGIDGTNGLPGTNSAFSSLITPGRPGGPAKAGQDASGGAVFNLGTMTLAGCSFANNQAMGGTGGKGGTGGVGGHETKGSRYPASAEGGSGGQGGNGGAAQGGAIASPGTLNLSGCTYSNSTAFGSNGGQGGDRPGSVGASIFSDDRPGYAGVGGLARGGAVSALGNFSVFSCFFVANTGLGGLGGPGSSLGSRPWSAGTNGGVATGGGIY